MSKLSKKSDIVKDLKSAVKVAGGTHQVAQSYGICNDYVRMVMAGTKDPGPSIFKPLGYEKVTAYRKITP